MTKTNKYFDAAIKSNHDYWKKVNIQDSSQGYLLYEAFYDEAASIYGITKTALLYARIRKLQPIGIMPLKSTAANLALIKSMNNCLIGKKRELIFIFVRKVFSLAKYFFLIKTKDDLLGLKISKADIGFHLYDALLIKFKLPKIDKLNSRLKFRVILELVYFYFFESILRKYKIHCIVIGDNAYRYGFIFELAKLHQVECIAPISLNTYSLKKNKTAEDFGVHYRTPNYENIRNLNLDIVNKYLNSYFEKRFQGDISQHDVLTAFSKKKHVYDKASIIKAYGLNKDLPITIVMAHIFCDAPHSYPGMLYDDYYDWLEVTIQNLRENKKINFLVKEHPSSHLYKQKGLVKEILEKHGLGQYFLREDVHTLTVLNEFDSVITCGGTIGLEFAYKGKPIVVAAKPPFAGFGFTIEPESRADYERLLKAGIEKLQPIDSDVQDIAKKVIYHDFVLLDNYLDKLELGGQRYYLGKNFNYQDFYFEIVKYNEIPFDSQLIYKILATFAGSAKQHLISEESALSQ